MSDIELKELGLAAIQKYLSDSKYTKDYIELNFPTALKLAINNAEQLVNRELGASMIMKGQHMITYSSTIQAKIVDSNVKLLLPSRANFGVW